MTYILHVDAETGYDRDMSLHAIVLLLLLLWPGVVMPLPAHAEPKGQFAGGGEQSTIVARDLVQQVQNRLRSDTSIARYTMRIETADWQRQVRLDAWDDRTKKRFFIRILAPRKDKNTTWLKDGENLWMYLVKMESVVKDYTHTLLSDQDGIYTVESVPKPDAPVVWGKIVRRITHDVMPLSEDYYDEHGKHIRKMVFDQVQHLGGRDIPSRWTMQAVDTPDKRTVMILENIVFDAPIKGHVFSRANLRSKGR